MRFMMLMRPGGYADAPADALRDAGTIAAMARYNQELRRAGVLLSLDGLHPPALGVRVSFEDGRPRVTDGPVSEAGEAVGGYWIIDVASKADAVDWARRCPAGAGSVVEVRQVQELTEFPLELQKAAGW